MPFEVFWGPIEVFKMPRDILVASWMSQRSLQVTLRLFEVSWRPLKVSWRPLEVSFRLLEVSSRPIKESLETTRGL